LFLGLSPLDDRRRARLEIGAQARRRAILDLEVVSQLAAERRTAEHELV
jgi:hypothetical protein